MKTYRNCLLPAFALAAFASPAWAEKEVVVRRVDGDSPHRIVVNLDDTKIEMEKVTYLGVETAPMSRALGSQLGLPKDTGLVVANVVAKSPATDVLKEDDVLTRLDDQLLINQQQLGVLVRSKKDGDEIRLTLVRAGKEMTVKVKLAVRELPRHADVFFRHGESGDELWNSPLLPDSVQGLARLRELPGLGPDGAQDVLRMIERERGNFVTGPGVRIVARAGQGSTIVDLPKSDISYSDDEGSIEIKVDEGKRSLTIKDAKGTVTFAGPINTAEERKQLPAAVGKRLEKMETDTTVSYEVGDDFKPDAVPLPPPPAKTKIGQKLDSVPSAPAHAGQAF
jgi:hypothetical protein